MPATTVPSATVPPAMAAAVLRPGATTFVDIDDLHASLVHAHEGNLRETMKQIGIRLTGTIVPYSECAVVKEVGGSVSRSTVRRSTRLLDSFNDWRGRGYDDSVPGEVTKTIPSGDRTT